ncbi:hypothetical protein FB107DRAFT_272012 [Schizophyllum commune]
MTLRDADPFSSSPTPCIDGPTSADAHYAFNYSGGGFRSQDGSGAEATAALRLHRQDDAQDMSYHRPHGSRTFTYHKGPFLADVCRSFSNDDGCIPPSDAITPSFFSGDSGLMGPPTKDMDCERIGPTREARSGAVVMGHSLHTPSHPLELSALPFPPTLIATSDAICTSHPLRSISTDAATANVQATTDQTNHRSQVGSDARAKASSRRRRKDHACRKEHACPQPSPPSRKP